MKRRICVAVIVLLVSAAWPAVAFADGGWGSDPPYPIVPPVPHG
jgi:hypothetical protein